MRVGAAVRGGLGDECVAGGGQIGTYCLLEPALTARSLLNLKSAWRRQPLLGSPSVSAAVVLAPEAAVFRHCLLGKDVQQSCCRGETALREVLKV